MPGAMDTIYEDWKPHPTGSPGPIEGRKMALSTKIAREVVSFLNFHACVILLLMFIESWHSYTQHSCHICASLLLSIAAELFKVQRCMLALVVVPDWNMVGRNDDICRRHALYNKTLGQGKYFFFLIYSSHYISHRGIYTCTSIYWC